MAWTETYHCDVCGKAKNEEARTTGGWRGARNSRPRRMIRQQPVLKITPWNRFLSHDADVKHLCGARCAQTIMDRWMLARNEESGD